MKSASYFVAGLLGFGTVFGLNSAHAAAGSLDPTFGSGGRVVTSFVTRAAPFQSAIPTAAALDSDGKIVVALGLDNSAIATTAFGAVRYLSNGNLDTTFGHHGFQARGNGLIPLNCATGRKTRIAGNVLHSHRWASSTFWTPRRSAQDAG